MSATSEVLYVLPLLERAGAERVVAELARRLPAHGFRSSVLCLEDERAPIGIELAAEGISVQGLRLSRRRTLACAWALAKLIPPRRPLIVHAHLFHANLAARLAYACLSKEERNGLHMLSTVHVVERRWRPWQFALDRLTARYARVEVCVSRAVARFQQERTRLPAGFFRVIENGIDLRRFVAQPSGLRHNPEDCATGSPRNPEDCVTAPLVVSIGRLDRQKDFPTLLRAWRIVNARLPAARLAIAGVGSEAARLRALCEKLELRNVEFSGFVADVAAWLQGASLYVQSSAWEGFGLAVAEAMACARPVIVSDADSLPELVTHGQTGLVFPKGRHADLAEAMLNLLQDPPRAAELGVAASAEAQRRFSVERMAAEYARLYQEIVSVHPLPRGERADVSEANAG
ncbi:MAG: glycosyltransferase family 4 protein [Planctomycetota bacterium]